MASADGITVAFERAIHDGLKGAIAAINREHGIRVTDIAVRWTKSETIGLPAEFSISGLVATTESGDA